MISTPPFPKLVQLRRLVLSRRVFLRCLHDVQFFRVEYGAGTVPHLGTRSTRQRAGHDTPLSEDFITHIN